MVDIWAVIEKLQELQTKTTDASEQFALGFAEGVLYAEVTREEEKGRVIDGGSFIERR